MKIDKKDLEKMSKSVNREVEIENGQNVNRHRVHKNKKAYNRREGKKIKWD